MSGKLSIVNPSIFVEGIFSKIKSLRFILVSSYEEYIIFCFPNSSKLTSTGPDLYPISIFESNNPNKVKIIGHC